MEPQQLTTTRFHLLISRLRHNKRKRENGYTLIEVMAATAIIGITFGLFILALDPTAQAESDIEARGLQLQATLEQLAEDAVLMNVQYGLRVHADGYDVLQHGQIQTESGLQPAWLLVDQPWAKNRLASQYLLSVSVNGGGYETPAKADDDNNSQSNESTEAEGNQTLDNLPQKPQVLLLSSGESTQTSIRISDEINKTIVVVQLDPLGRASLDWSTNSL